MIINNEQLSPREHVMMEAEKEENRLSREHALQMQKLGLEVKKTELRLKQEEAVKSRKHQQQMKELELAIRQQQVKWQNLLRIPLLIILFPVYFVLALGGMISLVRTKEIPEKLYQLIK